MEYVNDCITKMMYIIFLYILLYKILNTYDKKTYYLNEIDIIFRYYVLLLQIYSFLQSNYLRKKRSKGFKLKIISINTVLDRQFLQHFHIKI